MKIWKVLVALLIAGCVVESGEIKLARLESIRREMLGDIARQRGECEAVSIEFKGDRQMLDNCLETLRLVIENARYSISDIDAKIEDLRRITTPAQKTSTISGG